MIPLTNIPPEVRANPDLMQVIQPYLTRAEQLAKKYIKREKFSQHLSRHITKRLQPLRTRPNFDLAFCRITEGMVAKQTYMLLKRNVDLFQKGITNAENCIARMKQYAEKKERERAAKAKEGQHQATDVETDDDSYDVSSSEDTKFYMSDTAYKTALSEDSSTDANTD